MEGPSALLTVGNDSAQIRLGLGAYPNSYEAVLIPAANDELIFDQETVNIRQAVQATLGRGHRETRLHAVSGQPPGGFAGSVVDLLLGCKVFHFHDTSAHSPVKRMVPTADNLSLHPDGGNLAAFLMRLQAADDTTDKAAYRRIVGAVQLVAPFFRDFVLAPEGNDRVRLRWLQVDADTVFSANQMSDGTLRFICLATLLLQPEPPALVVLDEPELGLHPFAIVQLAGLLTQASQRSQVLVATQSVTLMNQFELDNLIVVERHHGASTFSRPDVDTLQAWLNEYSLGELWEKNMLGGRPNREEQGNA